MTIRSDSSRTAIAHLRQARRLDQISHRLELIANAKSGEDTKRDRHVQLNLEALKAIRRDLVWKDTWQKKLHGQICDVKKDAQNTYKPKWMKLNSDKFMKLYEQFRGKAIIEDNEAKQKRYAAKEKGHWDHPRYLMGGSQY